MNHINNLSKNYVKPSKWYSAEPCDKKNSINYNNNDNNNNISPNITNHTFMIFGILALLFITLRKK
jgi:hypothetical protein